MEMTMDQFDGLDRKIDSVLAKTAEMHTDIALVRQETTTIKDHLARLNGRVGKSEERLNSLDTLTAEARGAWKLVVLICAIPASVIAAIAVWISQHK